MPMPKPKPSETEKDFISRFMEDEEMKKEYPDDKQRLAVASSEWRKNGKKSMEFKKYEKIDFKPTQAMAKAAKRGLEMRAKQPPSNRGGTAVGLARARQLINRQILSPSTVKRMYSFFSRHEIDKQSESWKKGNSKAEQAWNLWGSDPGFAWSKKKVEQMKREDEKKAGDNILELEHKSFTLEIKSINEKGIFKGVASPYNNVDYGNDRVMPTIAPRNNNKEVPYLWQHNPHEPIGKVKLIATKKGMEFEGSLFLDENEKGIPLIPNAQKAYILMKNNQLKNSIGYNTLDSEYVTEKNITIRNLKDIDIMEVSAVTFPMNNKATIDSVKENGGGKVEEKALSFNQRLNLQDAQRKRWQLVDALNSSIAELIRDENMDEKAKMDMLETNIDEFSEAYLEAMSTLIKASATNKTAKKNVADELETKSAEDIQKSDPQQEKPKDDIIEPEKKGSDIILEGLANIFLNKKEEGNE